MTDFNEKNYNVQRGFADGFFTTFATYTPSVRTGSLSISLCDFRASTTKYSRTRTAGIFPYVYKTIIIRVHRPYTYSRRPGTAALRPHVTDIPSFLRRSSVSCLLTSQFPRAQSGPARRYTNLTRAPPRSFRPPGQFSYIIFGVNTTAHREIALPLPAFLLNIRRVVFFVRFFFFFPLLFSFFFFFLFSRRPTSPAVSTLSPSPRTRVHGSPNLTRRVCLFTLY